MVEFFCVFFAFIFYFPFLTQTSLRHAYPASDRLSKPVHPHAEGNATQVKRLYHIIAENQPPVTFA